MNKNQRKWLVISIVIIIVLALGLGLGLGLGLKKKDTRSYFNATVQNNTQNLPKKIAFITAIMGNYEASTKKYVEQSIPCDFILFYK